MRPRLRTIVIFALTLALLGFFLRNADPAVVWAETRAADPWLLLAALLATASTYVLRAWRWQSLLAPIGHARFSVALKTTIIGFAASAVLPARAGEVLRPYLLARRESMSATAAFATIILERLLDLATVLLLFAAFVFTVPPGVITADGAHWADVKFWGGVSAGAAVAGLVVLFALAGHPERLGRAALGVERVLPGAFARKASEFVETFAQGLAVMRRPGRLLAALAQSFPLWLSIAAGIWLTSRAFSITFPFPASFLVTALLVIGVAVPTPGAVGGFHAAYLFAVTVFFGVPNDRAVGAAVVLHAISFLPVTLAGIALMAGEGLTLSGARKIASEAAPDGGVPITQPGRTTPTDDAPAFDPVKKAAR
ncbi:MAG: flippase-like domain-containing protein [Acidobacteria bacterium]|nr:flippase-like domain-containing protein [Acidobacteriota bacterium]